MAIGKIVFGRVIAPMNEPAKAKEKAAAGSGRADRVELSEEAKLLFAAEKAKEMGAIRARVKTGFYNSHEVTERVVEGVLRDLQRPSQV
jgi:hypothetical protein